MDRFQTLFFSSYIAPGETIVHVFHRHFFVIVEDMILWIFFGLFLPGFMYFLDVFHIQSALSIWYIYGYILALYVILMYKVFDWYTDVWILTEKTLIDLKWTWFTSNLVIIPFEKVEGIEVRTYSWIYSILGISDIVVKLLGNESLILHHASIPTVVVKTLQEAISPHKKHAAHDSPDEREPFDILVDTLSEVVKGHLVTRGREYITRDYVEKLDHTLTRGIPIDLRTPEEKIIIDAWKQKYNKKEEHHDEHGGHGDSHDTHGGDHDDHGHH